MNVEQARAMVAAVKQARGSFSVAGAIVEYRLHDDDPITPLCPSCGLFSVVVAGPEGMACPSCLRCFYAYTDLDGNVSFPKYRSRRSPR